MLCYLKTGSQGVETLSISTLKKVIAFSVGDPVFVRSEVSSNFASCYMAHEDNLGTKGSSYFPQIRGRAVCCERPG